MHSTFIIIKIDHHSTKVFDSFTNIMTLVYTDLQYKKLCNTEIIHYNTLVVHTQE